MSESERFFGPLLSSAQHKTVFAGDHEAERMSLVRNQIFVVRRAWQNESDYRNLLDVVRRFVRPDTQPKSIRGPMQRLLQGFRDYADVDLARPESSLPEQYDALELYCSKEGYDYLFRLISQTLRLDTVPEEMLLTAVTLVELLTIDMYNLRLSHIGDDKYANFQGITYRGLRVDSRMVQEYRDVSNHPDLKKRGFSVPLAPISTSTDPSIMTQFAQGDKEGNSEQMYWTIHIHGIDPDLLREYSRCYPESIVTSICSLPVGSVSPFGEKEILLRGIFFQLLRMTTEQINGHVVHKLELVMSNANRDHTTELGSNEGDKKKQRDAFRRIAMASKYEVCASLVAGWSASEAEEYKRLQQSMLDELRDIDGIEVARRSDLADLRSGDVPVWLGGRTSKSFPRHYTTLRRRWQDAISKGHWADAEKILAREYDWRCDDWYNIGKLIDIPNVVRPSFTLTHELASQDIPNIEDEEGNYLAWRRLVDRISTAQVWSEFPPIEVLRDYIR